MPCCIPCIKMHRASKYLKILQSASKCIAYPPRGINTILKTCVIPLKIKCLHISSYFRRDGGKNISKIRRASALRAGGFYCGFSLCRLSFSPAGQRSAQTSTPSTRGHNRLHGLAFPARERNGFPCIGPKKIETDLRIPNSRPPRVPPIPPPLFSDASACDLWVHKLRRFSNLRRV